MCPSSWLIDCHVHTSCYSPCSRLFPELACQRALAQGLDGLVLTEHQIQWPLADLAVLRRNYPNLALYSGLEVTLAEGFDVVCLIPEVDMVLPYGLGILELNRHLAPFGEETFCFLAHPFRFLEQWDPDIDRLVPFVQGVEMNSVNILRGQACWDQNRLAPCKQALYERLATYGLVPLFNSDAHLAEAIGTVATRVALENDEIPRDTAELASFFRATPQTSEWQHKERLLPLVAL
ncbi:MAG: PHP-associated domain-containing protein [Thermodesulfobacteriota bacterium]